MRGASSVASSPSNDLLERIRVRNTERAQSAPAQLPLWPEPVRGVPNGVLRSALFGAIRRGKRRYLQREPIASVEGVSIVYTGPRLDQSDLDVWEGALHLARQAMLGTHIEFTEKGFLRLIGRGGERGSSLGKSDREWLKNVLARLSATTVEIKQGPFAYGGSLVDEYYRNEDTGRYVLVLNACLKLLFGRAGWTGIDWCIRQKLRGHPLAQWLQGFYATHAAPFPMKVATLHKLCGSETGEAAKTTAARHKALLDWRDDSLIPALNALASASRGTGQDFFWHIDHSNLVNVSKTPSKAQMKHLRARKMYGGLTIAAGG